MLSDYMSDVAEEMAWKSSKIRRDFAHHRQSAGENREGLVRQFLADHLPERFGVDTGFVISLDGKFSKQADLLIVDKENNAPLYPSHHHRLWPVESVYALIEVKTRLRPSDLYDAFSKGQRFKSLKRDFCSTRTPQHIEDSLFVIWAFESSRPLTVKKHLLDRQEHLDTAQQPDLVIVPDRLVASMGKYWELANLGHPNSEYRRNLEKTRASHLSELMDTPPTVYDLGKNSLLAWYVWLDSWLRQAGSRFCDPIKYLPQGHILGRSV